MTLEVDRLSGAGHMRLLGKVKTAAPRVLRYVMLPVRMFGKSWLAEYRLIGQIWKGTFPARSQKFPLSPLERLFMMALVLTRSFSLGRLAEISSCYMVRSALSEAYVVLWLLILTALLWHAVSPLWLLICIVVYRTVDGMNHILCILFVNRYKEGGELHSVGRSLLLLGLNFAGVVIAFAILFLNTASAGPRTGEAIAKPVTALYFSLVTITTLGFGDLKPLTDLGLWLVISETFLGFVFVVLVLAAFLTGLASMKEMPPE